MVLKECFHCIYSVSSSFFFFLLFFRLPVFLNRCFYFPPTDFSVSLGVTMGSSTEMDTCSTYPEVESFVFKNTHRSVSYTHLTLPTTAEV